MGLLSRVGPRGPGPLLAGWCHPTSCFGGSPALAACPHHTSARRANATVFAQRREPRLIWCGELKYPHTPADGVPVLVGSGPADGAA
ncbi:hypothetical protein AAFF_G00074250 [Aldrovandia affinis]|uniref:Uncharacterized protein n=1 Tax=Aldrovandia affinis TaxID=143900 RepID=A0AAD7WD07_9TELE|nr:hypothetical protein AAFF_G00074250 [Aldrovandia affinis]